jgi:hypothetical protein
MRRSYVIRELKSRISWLEEKYPDRRCVPAARELGAMQSALKDIEMLYKLDQERRAQISEEYKAMHHVDQIKL